MKWIGDIIKEALVIVLAGLLVTFIRTEFKIHPQNANADYNQPDTSSPYSTTTKVESAAVTPTQPATNEDVSTISTSTDTGHQHAQTEKIAAVRANSKKALRSVARHQDNEFSEDDLPIPNDDQSESFKKYQSGDLPFPKEYQSPQVRKRVRQKSDVTIRRFKESDLPIPRDSQDNDLPVARDQ